MSMYTALA